jgi:hypothetical protein
LARKRKERAKDRRRWRFPDWANWAILLLVVVASGYWIYVNFFAGPPVYQLPANVTLPNEDWMTYIPSGTSYLQVYNYSNIISSPAGLRAIRNDTALYISDNGFNLTATNTVFVMGVWFSESQMVNVFRPKPQVYEDFYSYTNSTIPSSLQKGVLYFYPSPTGQAQATKAFLVFYDGYVFYAEGGVSAWTLIDSMIQTHLGLNPGFFTQERRLEYYLITNTKDRVMGFNYLPGASEAGTHEIVTIAYDSGGYISQTDFYAYATQAEAINRYQDAKKSFFAAFHDSYIIGNFISATRTYRWEEITTVLSMI